MTPEQKEEFNHCDFDEAAKIIDPEAFRRWENGDGFERLQVINRMVAAREKAKAIAALNQAPPAQIIKTETFIPTCSVRWFVDYDGERILQQRFNKPSGGGLWQRVPEIEHGEEESS